ncbi:hypothetical protein SCHPADRAFT_941448 [Schizopora paradoxa]|uniref:Cellobiose dehydrogenase cytochrome domain-containing protein n=1 Tax=Schizopora paradoxa TaxID=27342 RepID=A0A0H2S5H2_9AGAM|nr:hypothetical protein SCHPADRAFT_941448 [Schizopora paradoxa]
MSRASLTVLLLCALKGSSAALSNTSSVERSEQVCSGSGHTCFETTFFNSAGNKFSIGFALPKLNDKSGIMIVNASIPLPYGFISFTLGTSELNNTKRVQPVPEMGMFVDEAIERENDPPPLNLTDVRAQLSIQDGESRLVPTGSSNTTVSALSSRTADRVDIIVRFQDSSLAHMPIFTSESPQLSAVFSLNPPQCLDRAERKAELYLNGSIPIFFTLNGKKARSINFDNMIKDVGFNP